jgi:hypothetical protein
MPVSHYLCLRGFAIFTETYQTEEDPNRTLCRSRYYKKTRRPQETLGISCSERPPPPSLNSHEATRLDLYRDTVNRKVQEIVSQYDEEPRHSLMELKDKEPACYNKVRAMVREHSGAWGLEHIFEQSTGKVDQPDQSYGNCSTEYWLYTPLEPSMCVTTNETARGSRRSGSQGPDGQTTPI